jgi:hypothetical protein
MVIVIALVVIALAGFAAYAYLRASRIATGGEERLAIVFGFAFALLLRPESPVEFVTELVAVGTIVLSIAAIAHLATVALRDPRASGVTG